MSPERVESVREATEKQYICQKLWVPPDMQGALEMPFRAKGIFHALCKSHCPSVMKMNEKEN